MSTLSDFRALLERKKSLLERVREVTREQAALIAKDDTDGLLDNVARRQHLIDEIDSVQGDMPPEDVIRADAACRGLAWEINEILREIQAHDAENEKAAMQRMAAMSDELKRMRRGKTSMTGYGGGGGETDATYFDKKH